MLILTRKAGQSIVIGDNIVLKVVSVDGDQIKLGIDAPKAVQIYRQEVYESIQQENQLAGKLSSGISMDVLKRLGMQDKKE